MNRIYEWSLNEQWLYCKILCIIFELAFWDANPCINRCSKNGYEYRISFDSFLLVCSLCSSVLPFARLKGGYQALNMGFPHEAMVDMTGGVTEVFSVAALPHDSGYFLEGLLRRGALINCASTQVCVCVELVTDQMMPVSLHERY